MLRPLDFACDGFVLIRGLSIKSFVIVNVVGIEACIQCRIPATLKTNTKQPVRVGHRVTTQRNKGAMDFLQITTEKDDGA